MKTVVVMAICLAVGALAPSKLDAACNPPGSQWGLSEQHLYDWLWEEVGTCTAWKSVNGADRPFNADTCSHPLVQGYQGRMRGANGVGVVRSWYQDVTLDEWGTVDIVFIPNIVGNLGTWDVLRVTLRDPSDNSWLENVTTIRGSDAFKNCVTSSTTLANDYSDQSVRLHFEATIWSGSTSDAFIVDAVTLYTTP